MGRHPSHTWKANFNHTGKLLTKTVFVYSPKMAKETQQPPHPSPHESMILPIRGISGAGDQLPKPKRTFSLFTATDQN